MVVGGNPEHDAQLQATDHTVFQTARAKAKIYDFENGIVSDRV